MSVQATRGPFKNGVTGFVTMDIDCREPVHTAAHGEERMLPVSEERGLKHLTDGAASVAYSDSFRGSSSGVGLKCNPMSEVSASSLLLNRTHCILVYTRNLPAGHAGRGGNLSGDQCKFFGTTVPVVIRRKPRRCVERSESGSPLSLPGAACARLLLHLRVFCANPGMTRHASFMITLLLRTFFGYKYTLCLWQPRATSCYWQEPEYTLPLQQRRKAKAWSTHVDRADVANYKHCTVFPYPCSPQPPPPVAVLDPFSLPLDVQQNQFVPL